MWKQLVLTAACLYAASCGNEPAVSKAVAEQSAPPACKSLSNPVPFDGSIGCARALREQGRFDAAELRLRATLPAGDAEKARLAAEIASLNTVRGQLAQLDAVERLADGGQVEAAADQLGKLAPELKDPQVATRFISVSDMVERDQDDVAESLRTLWNWSLAALPFLVLLGLAWLVRGALWLMLRKSTPKWRLTEVLDKTERETKELIAHHFSNWSQGRPSPAMSGLLTMEASAVPAYPSLDLDHDQFDISPDLETADVTIGGVSIKGWVGILPKLKRWFLPQPTAIKGFSYIDKKGSLCARLTTRRSEPGKNDTILSVSAVVAESDEAATEKVAEEVTFKMLYALSSGDEQAAAAADELRKGLGYLRDYLSGVAEEGKPAPWDRLEDARAVFERVRATQPESLEAHLYEGIALDLSEQHEDAVAHFDHVRDKTEGLQDEKSRLWHDQATYNGAVAHLRNLYGRASIDEAIGRLEAFIGDKPDYANRPILALAEATLADAWANRTIEWKSIQDAQLNLAEGATDGDKLAAVIGRHRVKVERSLDRLEKGLAPIQAALKARAGSKAGDAASKWDDRFARQVDWAISAARADFNLYAATSLARQGDENQAYMDLALAGLRKCEMLLPAGVETLSNLGTFYLTRGKDGDLATARHYFQRAIALNPTYEYAYYRLARAWEKENWREKVVATLKSCPIPPRIPSFRNMFVRYYVEPKFDYPRPRAQEVPPAAARPAEAKPAPGAAAPAAGGAAG